MTQISRQSDVTILDLGESYDSLDTERIERLTRMLREQAEGADPPRLLLDLSRTRFIGSSFLEAVMLAWKQVRARSGILALCGLTPLCREVFEAAQLDSIWTLYPTRAEAVEALAG